MRNTYLPYYEPAIDDDDIAAVADAMRRGWLTTGPKAREFEVRFAAACGVKHAIALSSCTAGLHLGLIALGVAEGDEVIMPSLSFVAGANCVRQIGAKPVFCDIDERTLCINPVTIERVRTSRTKLVMPMLYGGHPVGMGALMEYARGHGIRVLEDAAHGAGTLDDGEWPGVRSDAAVYSFYATKNLTSAEGGMLVTNSDELADCVRMLALHGMDRDAWKRYTHGGTWRYDVTAVGYKYNLPDIAAAIAITQLSKFDKLQGKREELAAIYVDMLHAIPGITPIAKPLAFPNRHSWCIFGVRINESEAGISRDLFIEKLRERNIGTSVHFIPTHLFGAYRDSTADVPVTDRVWLELVSLPLFPTMTHDDVRDVVDAIKDALSPHSNVGSPSTQVITT